jgi:hypothetical protein
VQLLHGVGAGLQLGIRQAEGEAAGPPVSDIDARLVPESGGKLRPPFSGRPDPSDVFGHAEALGLDPDQGEVASRGPEGGVALVEHRDLGPPSREPPGDGGADHASPDHGDLRVPERSPAHDRALPERTAEVGTPRRPGHGRRGPEREMGDG